MRHASVLVTGTGMAFDFPIYICTSVGFKSESFSKTFRVNIMLGMAAWPM